MAHSGDRGPGSLKSVLAAALALAALDARALTLGEPQVRSGLGENLDLRIPVTIDKGESIEPSCFSLASEPAQSVPRLAAARFSLERSAVATYLRVRTEMSVGDPALAVGIVAACPGQFAEVRREYTVLIDPAKGAAAPAPGASAGAPAPEAPTQAAPPTESALPSIATLIARIGDTLESIAHAIFPSNRSAKNSYIRALRETNPPLASLGDRDPIPIDTPIALPDLRTFEHSRAQASTRIAATPPAPREASAAPSGGERVAAPAAAPEPARRAPTRQAPARRAAERAAPPPAAPELRIAPATPPAAPRKPAAVRSQTIAPGFTLKLSSGEMDLSPSRSVDDRMRAQLRDRQLVLDADDQVAAVLALRNSVRQLESRVAELQLKLAGMPSSFPAPKSPEPQPAPAAPRNIEPTPSTPAPPTPAAATPAPRVPEAQPTPPPAIAPPVAPAAAPAEAPSPPPVARPAETPPQTEATPPVVEKPAPPAPAATSPDTTPKKAAAQSEGIDWLYYALWVLAFLLVAAAILLAMRLARRRRDESYEYGEESEPVASDDEIVVALEPPPSEDDVFAEDDEAVAMAQAHEVAAAAPQSAQRTSDDLRRRYIEERFPEIGKGAISLDDPASVVKGARLFYEDGAIARAVELLQFAIEHQPDEVRSWLALFEIFRLEGLKGEFADLAHRFHEQHGTDAYWRKVQYFGREIDPGNELYAEKPLNTFETIGPTQAGRLAAEASFDPVAENWLGAPMDFQNEVLANELRKALMSAAGIGESDLVPNPMPALRNVEMFTVA
ncbi:MAG: FimV/HubP-related protein [Usitatibacter sp.]